jgi:hypothetical protein
LKLDLKMGLRALDLSGSSRVKWRAVVNTARSRSSGYRKVRELFGQLIDCLVVWCEKNRLKFSATAELISEIE